MESELLYHDEENNDLDEPPNMQAALDQFRSQWQEELKQTKVTPGGGNRKDSQGESEDRPCNEAQAKYLFVQGMQLEQDGQLYEAVKYYRKAIQLVPDIEFRIDMQPFTRKKRERQESESSVNSLDGSIVEDSDVGDLGEQFRCILATQDNICQPEFQQQATHIAMLPVEILICIFKWVVSSEIDLRSLEQLATVCRGFYLCARDEGLWRLACLRVFGSSVRSCSKYGSWRNMYLEKPHLNFTGCYLSKSAYVRQGEKSLDSFYRPVHLVEYYRYVRFFPNGTMYMLTSPDDPYTIIPKLRDSNTKLQGIMYGYYRINTDSISCTFKRKKTVDNQTSTYRYRRHRQQQPIDNVGEQTFHAEFTLKRSGKRRNANLVWVQYCIHTFYKSSGREVTTDFDMKESAYPALLFSRVRSYAAMSNDPLQ